LVGVTALVALYVGFAVCGYANRWRSRHFNPAVAGLVVATLSCALLASRNIYLGFAAPQMLEYLFLRNELNAAAVAQAQSVYFIPASWSDSIAPIVRYDEFGLPSSAQVWGPEPMTYLVLRDLGKPLPVTIAPPTGPTQVPPKSLVVDLRRIKNYRWSSDR
jgi:hypothetical protein